MVYADVGKVLQESYKRTNFDPKMLNHKLDTGIGGVMQKSAEKSPAAIKRIQMS
jgi:hypothetical protein